MFILVKLLAKYVQILNQSRPKVVPKWKFPAALGVKKG